MSERLEASWPCCLGLERLGLEIDHTIKSLGGLGGLTGS
jgi:hypothetical protein